MDDWRTEVVRLAAVLAGGAAGSGVRYAVGRVASHYAAAAVEAFPWHTLAVNVAGSFVLGLVAVWYRPHPGWFLLFGTGFCGGFTTFSTFSVETLTLIEKGHPGRASLYAATSVAAGLLAAWAAVRFAR